MRLCGVFLTGKFAPGEKVLLTSFHRSQISNSAKERPGDEIQIFSTYTG